MDHSNYFELGRRGTYDGWDGGHVMLDVQEYHVCETYFTDDSFCKNYINKGITEMAYSILLFRELLVIPFATASFLHDYGNLDSFLEQGPGRFQDEVVKYDPLAFEREDSFWPTAISRDFP